MLKKVIEETTDSAVAMIESRKYKNNDPRLSETIPITIWCWGLESEEEIELQFPKVENPEENNDDHWTDAMLSLTSSDPHTAIYGAMIFRVRKPVTNSPVGVMYVNYKDK